MFVSKNRFILKTCGRTSLLHAVEPLLSLVHNECDMDRVDVSLQSLFIVSHDHNSSLEATVQRFRSLRKPTFNSGFCLLVG